MTPDAEIRDKLAAYLAEEITLQEFEEWFFPFTWGLDTALVSDIKLPLYEFSSDHRIEEELRAALMPLVTNYRATLEVRDES